MRDTAYESMAEFYLNGCYSGFEQEHRSGGSFGVDMFEVTQDAGAYTDPVLPDVTFVEIIHPAKTTTCDFGGGLQRHGIEMTRAIGPQPAGVECHLTMDTTHTIRALCMRADRLFPLLDRSGIREDPFEPFYARFPHDPLASQAFHRLWQTMTLTNPGDGLAVDAALLTFLALYTPSSGGALSPNWSAKREDKRIARVLDYIEAHLERQLLMSELAAVAHLSETHFARTFRATMGKTAHAYVTERRIARAKRALVATDDPITLIAFACGFGSSAHFATVFRQHNGVSPSAYRLQFE